MANFSKSSPSPKALWGGRLLGSGAAIAALMGSAGAVANEAPILVTLSVAQMMALQEAPDIIDDVAEADRYTLEGNAAQGSLMFGKVFDDQGRVKLDGVKVAVDADGNFVIGFGRDHDADAVVTIEYGDGTSDTRLLAVEDREFKEERIDGLPSSQVNEYTQEQLVKIRQSTAKKVAAREEFIEAAGWTGGFSWPAFGRISGEFGSRRILNGVPKRPHSGVDIAAPVGTDVRAPADGKITLADPDMYFEGGLIFINHGQGLESAMMHLSRLDVEAGQPVKKGEVIGAIGATGRATGPHLHWSLKWNKTLVDARLVAGDMDDQEAALAARIEAAKDEE